MDRRSLRRRRRRRHHRSLRHSDAAHSAGPGGRVAVGLRLIKVVVSLLGDEDEMVKVWKVGGPGVSRSVISSLLGTVHAASLKCPKPKLLLLVNPTLAESSADRMARAAPAAERASSQRASIEVPNNACRGPPWHVTL